MEGVYPRYRNHGNGAPIPAILLDHVVDASAETVPEASPRPDGEAGRAAGSMCTRCDGPMDGDSYISMDQPPMVCHQGCFTCAVCGCILGDLQTPMFLRGQKIHCESCYFNSIYSCGAGEGGGGGGGEGRGVGGGQEEEE